MGFYPRQNTICVPMSFEANEQLEVTVPFGSRVEILSVESQVVKALANTDAGTITIKDDDGDTRDTLSHALSAALGDTDTSTFAERVFIPKDGELSLTSAKTTAGGKVLVFITYAHVTPQPA